MVLESVETIGVRTVPFSRYLNNYDGKGNPYPGGFILIRHDDFTARFTKARKKKLGHDEEYICSEYVHRCY